MTDVTIFDEHVHKVWVDWMVGELCGPYGKRGVMSIEDFITKKSPQTWKTYYEEWLWKWPKRFE